MASLLQKVRVGLLTAAHGLVDAVIDMNSVGAVRQFIRDLEGSLDQLREATAEAIAYTRSLAREQSQLRAQIEELDGNIELILTDGNPDNDHLTTAMETKLMGLEARRDQLNEESMSADTTANQLQGAVAQLEARHTAMVNQLQQLQALDRASKARELAAATMTKASRAMSAGADASVDDVADKIRRRADVAGVKFEQAMGDLGNQVDKDVTLAEAKARIEARKAKLATS